MQDTNNTMDEAQMNINADADIPGNTHLSNPEAVSEEGDTNDAIEKLTADVEEQKDKYIRLLAEFDNFKRRTAKERIDLMQTAGKEMAIALLEVADDMDRAEKQLVASDDINVVKEGVQIIFNKLRTTLQQKGIVPMVSIDTDFDVEKHEAVTEIVAGDDKAGKVVDELQKGYYMNDKLIRFAKVVVGK
ncbi:nucleotide exchange factor GrpE [Ferruginibacter yonginensis]|uniref:Protein GrpE n=1 Tax=Ferruginibacter yonginensis TaxID=1310416 RepID=A0ABV8QPU9_9BACT